MKAKQSMRKPLWVGIVTAILLLTLSVILPVTCFAATEGITDVSISLSEDIIVKFYTSATTGDGSKLLVSFNDETTEITENLEGVFTFTGVTPQNLNDEMTAIMYAADGTTQLGEVKTVSVKSYLEAILALEYESSGCSSQLQYAAMRELAVNMLNYGAAAQSYIEHDIENLANKDLTPEQKALATGTITVGAADTDKAVSGDAWVGAGVRFDYKLGLYFVFKAESLEGITASVNGTEVTPEAYTVRGVAEPCWIIRYNAFNATNMNDVVTAKLTMADSSEQTFAYSIKSYVAAKGGAGNALSDLVNATYAYGFAAVAYVAEYVEVAPTFEQAGSITMDGKGYDFSGSKYGSVELPALNFTDYTVVTVNEGDQYTPVVKTTFTLKSDVVAYTLVFTADNCISLDGTLYSPYDLANASIADVTVTYDAAKGYTFDVANGKTVTLTKSFTSYGADLTVLGNISFNTTETWGHYGINVTVGTAAKAADITMSNTTNTTLYVYTDTKFLVSEGSALTITKSPTKYSIYIGGGDVTSRAALIVDGTLTVKSKGWLRASHYLKTDSALEYGFDPQVYVRRGTLTVPGMQLYSLQVGSESENASGTLVLTGCTNDVSSVKLQKDSKTSRFVFAKGTVEFKGLSITSGLWNNDKNDAYIDVRGGMEFIMTDCTMVSVLRVGGGTGNHRTYIQSGVKYYSYSTETGVKTDISETNEKFLHHNYGTSHLYTWDVVEVKMMVEGAEVTKTVRVCSYTTHAAGTYQSAAACSAAPQLPADAVVTATETTQEMGALGTFTQGTYVDGAGATQTVWYQIVE